MDLVFANWRGIVARPDISDADEAAVRRPGHRDARQPDEWKDTLAGTRMDDAFLAGDEFTASSRGEPAGRPGSSAELGLT